METPVTIPSPRWSQRTAALVSGTSLVVMAFLAMFAEMGMRQQLVVPGDAAATSALISGAPALFTAGLAAFFCVALLDVLAACGLQAYFRPVHADVSALAAWLRLLYAAIFLIAIGALFIGFRWVMQGGVLQASGMSAFAAFDLLWDVALVVFGLHLLLIGWLSWRSGRVPRWLAVTMCLAGIGYCLDSGSQLLVQGGLGTAFTAVIALPAAVGELGLAIWLLTRRK